MTRWTLKIWEVGWKKVEGVIREQEGRQQKCYLLFSTYNLLFSDCSKLQQCWIKWWLQPILLVQAIPPITWSQSVCPATCSHLWPITKHPAIIWFPFSTFPVGFPRKSIEKLAEKIPSSRGRFPTPVCLHQPLYACTVSSMCTLPDLCDAFLHPLAVFLTHTAPLMLHPNPNPNLGIQLTIANGSAEFTITKLIML